MTETITTAAERDALLMAVGENARAACVEDRYGDTWLIVENDGGDFIAWSYPHEDYPDVHNWKMAEALEMPLTVLYRPDQPTPTVKPSVEGIIEALVSAAPEVYAERGVTWSESKAADIRASAGPYARAVLALLPGRTVDEVWRAAWESCCLRSGVDGDEALADYLAGGE
jgi:hypothetical protein